MIYAQISNNIIVNTIELDDATLVPFFSRNCDFCLQINNITDINGNTIAIGWFYNSNTNIFYPPLEGYQYPATIPTPSIYQNLVITAIDFGNYIISQMNADAASAGIYQAGQTNAWLIYLQTLYMYLQNGFLLDAIDEFSTLLADTSSTKTSLAPFITNTNLTTYQSLIQTWLNQA